MDCSLLDVMRQEKEQCFELLAEEKRNLSKDQRLMEEGCLGMWDNVSCWPSATIGKTVFLHCPTFLQVITGTKGLIYRNCTSDGWSETSPRVPIACDYVTNGNTSVNPTSYFNKLKDFYTVGYSLSIATLLMALVILGSFRRLRCTRNYIHMHLFASFVLRAVAVFIKDALLYSADEIDHCTVYMTGCKMMLVLFQYGAMANYSWLLVEGLYLHTLLFVSFFSEKKYFWWYIALGWGLPLVFIIAWSTCRQVYEDTGCWDINDNASIWWIIRGPIIMFIFINFTLYVRILRILMKKLKTSEVWGTNAGQYKDLLWLCSTVFLMARFNLKFRENGNSGI
ncbi:secretin receptor isoform X2 [Lissotriton helveticus]